MSDPRVGLGQAVKRRRMALDLSQRDAATKAGVSDQTWLNVENGRGASDRKLAQIERALEWFPGTIDAILASGPEPEEGRTRNDLEREVAQLRAEVAELRAAVQELTDPT